MVRVRGGRSIKITRGNSPIKLGVDARPLSWPESRGVQRVVKNLLREILERHAEKVELHLYSNRPFLYSPPQAITRVIPASSLRYAVTELRKAVKADDCDVFLGTGPAVLAGRCPSVLVVYDDSPRVDDFPVPLLSKIGHRYVAARLARRAKLWVAGLADALIFDSEIVERDVLAASPHLSGKERVVIHWATDPELHHLDRKESNDYVAKRLGITSPFILYVGAVNRPKNLEGLVSLYRRVREHHHRMLLVVVGGKAWPAYRRDPLENVEGIRYFPWLSDEAVAACYGACEVFVTLSWYEGFGLPVVEAMTHGAPVVVSNRGALPEVIGEAGLVVDPENLTHAAEVVCRFLDDSTVREQLRVQSLLRAKDFTWSGAADRAVALIQNVASKGC